MGRPQQHQQRLTLALSLSLLLPCISHSAAASTQTQAVQPGCRQGMPQPDQAFRVVWNHPDHCGNLNFNEYGIVYNTGRTFVGDEIQTLYKSGPWPMYPQLYNDSSFNETRTALGRTWKANFTGLAVIDFETWRANFNTNYGTLRKFQKGAIQLVRDHHPDWTQSELHQQAEKEWEEGAKFVMGGKLAVGQELMPEGHWGYYMYPRSWNGDSSPKQNDKMAWLWTKATGLYPSIYLTDPNQPVDRKQARVAKELAEAVRIQRTFSPPNTVIYPYSNINQGHAIFFQEDHLRITLGLPADMGASGIVLWGSSSYYRYRGQCDRLRNYIHTVLGPYVKQLTDFMSDCSYVLCGGNGRCVHNAHDSLISKEKAERLSASCTPRDSRFHDYHCRCYSFWEGDCCQTRIPSPCQPAQTTTGTDATTATAATGTTRASQGSVFNNVIG